MSDPTALNDVIALIRDVGVPAAALFFCLIRLEKRLDTLATLTQRLIDLHTSQGSGNSTRP